MGPNSLLLKCSKDSSDLIAKLFCNIFVVYCSYQFGNYYISCISCVVSTRRRFNCCCYFVFVRSFSRLDQTHGQCFSAFHLFSACLLVWINCQRYWCCLVPCIVRMCEEAFCFYHGIPPICWLLCCCWTSATQRMACSSEWCDQSPGSSCWHRGNKSDSWWYFAAGLQMRRIHANWAVGEPESWQFTCPGDVSVLSTWAWQTADCWDEVWMLCFLNLGIQCRNVNIC